MRLSFILSVLCLCSGCLTSSTPDPDGTWLGTLTRSGQSCDAPAPQATTGTFVVTTSNGKNLIAVELPGVSACQLVALGADYNLDSISDPPPGCAGPPAGFTFSDGSFADGSTPAELTLTWTQGACTVNDLWSLTRQ